MLITTFCKNYFRDFQEVAKESLRLELGAGIHSRGSGHQSFARYGPIIYRRTPEPEPASILVDRRSIPRIRCASSRGAESCWGFCLSGRDCSES